MGDEVIGFVDTRFNQAEFVVVEAQDLTWRPPNVVWEVAGAMFVPATAYASVRTVSAGEGDTVAISRVAGGGGSIAVQLVRNAGAEVIGLAGEANHG